MFQFSQKQAYRARLSAMNYANAVADESINQPGDEFISMRKSREVDLLDSEGGEATGALRMDEGTIGSRSHPGERIGISHQLVENGNDSQNVPTTILQHVITNSSSEVGRYTSAASSLPSGPSVIVG
jgi:hypothetical protein